MRRMAIWGPGFRGREVGILLDLMVIMFLWLSGFFLSDSKEVGNGVEECR